MDPSSATPTVRSIARQVAPWALVAAALMAVEIAIDLTTDVNYHRLVIDTAELSEDISVFEGLFSSLGIYLWFCSAAVLAFGAWVVGRDHALGPVLAWCSVLSVVLGVDDRMRIHEELSDAIGTGESVVFAVWGLLAAWIAWRYWRDVRPEWALAIAAGLAFGGSLVFDVVLEEILGASFPGEVFIEENAKLAGIVLWLGFSVHLTRRAVRTLQPGPSAPAP